MRVPIGIAVLSVVGVVAAVAVGAVWKSANDARDLSSPTRARAEGRPIPVRTATVQAGMVEEVIGASALTVSSEVVTITPGFRRDPSSTPLVVKEVLVWEGKQVSKGETLVRLDDTLMKRDLAAAEAALSAAKVSLDLAGQSDAVNRRIRDLEFESAESELAFRVDDLARLEVEYKRLNSLTKGQIPVIEVAKAFSILAEARFRRAEAEKQLLLQRARKTLEPMRGLEARINAEERLESTSRAVEIALRDLERAEIRSPIAGFADVVTIGPGEVLNRGDEITKIHRIDPIHVRANFPLERAHMVSVGRTVEVVLDNLPQVTFSGLVARISPKADESTKSLPVVIEISNPDLLIRPGISGFVRLRLERATTVVPSIAVLRRRSRAMVFTVADDVARIREVLTGAQGEGDSIEILSGIKPGENVVVFGARDLQDADRVNPEWQAWSGRE